MLKLITLLAFAFAACNGDAIQNLERFGSLNKYYYYSNAQRNSITLTEDHFPTGNDTAARFNNNWDIVVIIHGHSGTATTTINPIVKDAFLTSGDYNVIVVDWSSFSLSTYSTAVMAVTGVGSSIATFLKNLKLPLNKVHIVGFNLGAHVAGVTGRNLEGKVARITGLDPSARDWENNVLRLGTNDAQYVEVIHTDGSGVNKNGLGVAIGHIDFFVNGRLVQPGCTNNLCSHNRAYEVFAATITHGKHYGNQCSTEAEITANNCRGFIVEMGTAKVVKHGSGMFRVNTGMRYPFHL
ncbi:hypothetical protein F0L74_32750 [Chitinophaga agrisoli]|uniref:Lipase domain-containing protein n=1 Tax=Chitinophaga agrisoli TaxID=2607653 RepID=A0A5B2VDL7_9BACT|nr:hypothetical protein F0L74_32750 [Chitinophaga agrisoli]